MMMLAYGDALAMAVLEQKGFTKDDFGVLHPGGKLGKGLMRVRELMHSCEELPLVQPHEAMKDVLMTMTRRALGCAIVVNEDGALQGIITDGDLRRHINNDLMAKNAQDIMTRNPQTISQNMLAAEALGVLNGRAITCLVVLEGDAVVGLLHIHDCLRAGIA
jgi:arabinose-5-phosphate isomerase